MGHVIAQIEATAEGSVRRGNPTYAALDAYDDAVTSNDPDQIAKAAADLAEAVRNDFNNEK
jgi:hypothetical protein